MSSVIYVSSATSGFSDADLVSLLKQRGKECPAGYYGNAAVYKDGNIMQVLEGPDDAVRQLVKTNEVWTIDIMA